MLVVHPDMASQARPAVAAAWTCPASILAQTGYSSVSQSKSTDCWARPWVSHWYRWWWVLTRPGVARHPAASIRRAPSGTLAAGPSPTAVIRSPVTVMWPLRYSAPPSSCRGPSMVAIAQFSITTGPALISFPGRWSRRTG